MTRTMTPDDSAFAYFAIVAFGLYVAVSLYLSWGAWRNQVADTLNAAKARSGLEFEKQREQRKTRQLTWLFWGNLALTTVALCIVLYFSFTVLTRGAIEQYDPYAILQLPRSASEKDIKRNYRKLSLEFHPDKQGGNEEMFQKITKAYEALTDEVARENYRLYGNPDGRQALEIAIGLPSWLTAEENQMYVGFFYVAMMFVVLPALIYVYFSGAKEADRVKNVVDERNKTWMLLSMREPAEYTELLQVMAGMREMAEAAGRSDVKADETLDAKRARAVAALCGAPGGGEDAAAAQLAQTPRFWTSFLSVKPDKKSKKVGKAREEELARLENRRKLREREITPGVGPSTVARNAVLLWSHLARVDLSRHPDRDVAALAEVRSQMLRHAHKLASYSALMCLVPMFETRIYGKSRHFANLRTLPDGTVHITNSVVGTVQHILERIPGKLADLERRKKAKEERARDLVKERDGITEQLKAVVRDINRLQQQVDDGARAAGKAGKSGGAAAAAAEEALEANRAELEKKKQQQADENKRVAHIDKTLAELRERVKLYDRALGDFSVRKKYLEAVLAALTARSNVWRARTLGGGAAGGGGLSPALAAEYVRSMAEVMRHVRTRDYNNFQQQAHAVRQRMEQLEKATAQGKIIQRRLESATSVADVPDLARDPRFAGMSVSDARVAVRNMQAAIENERENLHKQRFVPLVDLSADRKEEAEAAAEVERAILRDQRAALDYVRGALALEDAAGAADADADEDDKDDEEDGEPTVGTPGAKKGGGGDKGVNKKKAKGPKHSKAAAAGAAAAGAAGSSGGSTGIENVIPVALDRHRGTKFEWVETAVRNLELVQRLTQALRPDDHPVLQLPELYRYFYGRYGSSEEDARAVARQLQHAQDSFGGMNATSAVAEGSAAASIAAGGRDLPLPPVPGVSGTKVLRHAGPQDKDLPTLRQLLRLPRDVWETHLRGTLQMDDLAVSQTLELLRLMPRLEVRAELSVSAEQDEATPIAEGDELALRITLFHANLMQPDALSAALQAIDERQRAIDQRRPALARAAKAAVRRALARRGELHESKEDDNDDDKPGAGKEEEEEGEEAAAAQEEERAAAAAEEAVAISGDDVDIRKMIVSRKRAGDDDPLWLGTVLGSESGRCPIPHAPFFPDDVLEAWHVIVEDDTGSLCGCKIVPDAYVQTRLALSFPCRPHLGRDDGVLRVRVISTAYCGVDAETEVRFPVFARHVVRDVKAEKEREEREEATREIATQQDPLGFNDLREQLMGSAVDYDIDEGDKRAHIAQARKGGKELLGAGAIPDDDDDQDQDDADRGAAQQEGEERDDGKGAAGAGSGGGAAGAAGEDEALDGLDDDERDPGLVAANEPVSDIDDDDF